MTTNKLVAYVLILFYLRCPNNGKFLFFQSFMLKCATYEEQKHIDKHLWYAGSTFYKNCTEV